MRRPPVKAITLWQPWASLIAAGVKTIETRSWRAPSALIGERIAIHAAAKRPDEGEEYGTGWWWTWDSFGPGVIIEQRTGRQAAAPLGAVVATAVLTECAQVTGGTDCAGRPWLAGGPFSVDLDQLPFGDYTPGRWAWLLDDIEPLTEPIPAKGAQRVWNWQAAA